MGYVGKIKDSSGTTHLVASTLFGTCSTAIGTAAKVVTCSNFSQLENGVTIHVYFVNGNTAANPTLNVNSTGAIAVKRYGTTAPQCSTQNWAAGQIVSFTYYEVSSTDKRWVMNDIDQRFDLITGTGETAQDKGEGVSPRYFPAKWKFNLNKQPQDGDIITIRIPCAGHTNGVYISLNNGTNYKPVSVNNTSRLTTHYANGKTITLVYESSGQTNDMYNINGGDARENITGGCWTVLNYYDANSDTKVRQTLTNGNTNRPILLAYSANTTTTGNVDNISYRDNEFYYNPSTNNLYLSGHIFIQAKTKGLYLTDSTNTSYLGIGDNGSNLWIGAYGSTFYAHTGSTYISSGWNGTNGNSTIFVSVPTLNGTTWSSTQYPVLHSNNYSSYALPLSGGTISGYIYYKSSTYDGSAANNGISSGVSYPTTFNVYDKSDRILARLEGMINSNGKIGAQLYVRNYTSSGTQVAQKGIKMEMDKNGTMTYTVSDGSAFRTAIGAGTSDLVIGTTSTTAMAGNTTFPLSIATDTGTNQLTLSANTKYKLTAGGSTYIFTTPPDSKVEQNETSSTNLYPILFSSRQIDDSSTGAYVANRNSQIYVKPGDGVLRAYHLSSNQMSCNVFHLTTTHEDQTISSMITQPFVSGVNLQHDFPCTSGILLNDTDFNEIHEVIFDDTNSGTTATNPIDFDITDEIDRIKYIDILYTDTNYQKTVNGYNIEQKSENFGFLRIPFDKVRYTYSISANVPSTLFSLSLIGDKNSYYIRKQTYALSIIQSGSQQTDPTYTLDIREFNSGLVIQFYGTPGTGSWSNMTTRAQYTNAIRILKVVLIKELKEQQ